MSKKQPSKNIVSKPSKKQPFTVYAASKSSTTSSRCTKIKRFLTDVVNYSLSPDELKSCPTTIDQPMRSAGPGELQILYNAADRSSGKHYLAKRLDQSPREKYYFPEATSWRIGWVQESQFDL